MWRILLIGLLSSLMFVSCNSKKKTANRAELFIKQIEISYKDFVSGKNKDFTLYVKKLVSRENDPSQLYELFKSVNQQFNQNKTAKLSENPYFIAEGIVMNRLGELGTASAAAMLYKIHKSNQFNKEEQDLLGNAMVLSGIHILPLLADEHSSFITHVIECIESKKNYTSL